MHKKIRVFYSYSHADEQLRNALETHLSIMKRQNIIEEWHDRKILGGTNWDTEIDSRIEKADIILILVSPDFIASEYCYGKELSSALSLHESGRAKVVPLIVRPVDWQDTVLGKLQALPKDAIPVTTWKNYDEAWLDIAKGLKAVAKEIAHKKPVAEPSTSSVPIMDVLKGELVRIQSLAGEKNRPSGIPTGIKILDQVIDGLHEEDIILIAGRPSMGATDLGLNILASVSLTGSIPSLLFSMRLTPEHVSRRLWASESEIPVHRIVRGEIYKRDFARLVRATDAFAKAKISIENHRTIGVTELERIVQNAKKSKGLGLLVIDGVEFITSAKAYSTKNDEIMTIAGALRSIAHTQRIPIIVTANTSRKAESRIDKRPRMDDLEEWEIFAENASSIVLLLHRDEVYNTDREDVKGMAEIIVSKNYYGPTTTVEVAYVEPYCTFRDIYAE